MTTPRVIATVLTHALFVASASCTAGCGGVPEMTLYNGGLAPEPSACELGVVRVGQSPAAVIAGEAQCDDEVSGYLRTTSGVAFVMWRVSSAERLAGPVLSDRVSYFVPRYLPLAAGADQRGLGAGSGGRSLASGGSEHRLEAGESGRALSGGGSGQVLSAGATSQALAPGSEARALESGAAQQSLASGESSRALAGGSAAQVLQPGHSERALESGASARALGAGAGAQSLGGGGTGAFSFHLRKRVHGAHVRRDESSEFELFFVNELAATIAEIVVVDHIAPALVVVESTGASQVRASDGGTLVIFRDERPVAPGERGTYRISIRAR